MTDLPLFPLQAVLFPGGLLRLKVFEARYLDLVSTCLRERRPFGVVALHKGNEVRRGEESIVFEDIGVTAELLEVDSAQPGILHLRCRGTQRFRIGATRQQPDGLAGARCQTHAVRLDIIRDAADQRPVHIQEDDWFRHDCFSSRYDHQLSRR